jgi:hypothetical protein
VKFDLEFLVGVLGRKRSGVEVEKKTFFSPSLSCQKCLLFLKHQMSFCSNAMCTFKRPIVILIECHLFLKHQMSFCSNAMCTLKDLYDQMLFVLKTPNVIFIECHLFLKHQMSFI